MRPQQPESHLGSRVRVPSLPLFTSACLAERDSLDYHEELLAPFDDVCSELRAVAAADVLHRVDRFGRDEQDVAGFERRRRPALHPVLQRPFEDVENHFAPMLVPDEWRLRANVDAALDDLASGDAQIVPLEVRLIPGACCTVLLTFLGLVAGGHHDRSTRSSRQPQTKAGSGAHGRARRSSGGLAQ
jgi:hypothetical protein